MYSENLKGILLIALPVIAIWLAQGAHEAGEEWARAAQVVAGLSLAASIAYLIHKTK